MQETQSKEFHTAEGTVILSLNQLDGMKATLLFVSLTTKFGPALAGAKGKDKIQLLAELSSQLSPELFDHTLQKLLSPGLIARWPSQDKVEPEAKDKLGQIFKGKPFEIFNVLLWALELNYGDFFKLTQENKSPAS